MIKSKSIKILESGKIEFQTHVNLWSFFGHVKDKEVYFLHQGWSALVQMTENEGKSERETALTKILDENNQESKLLK